MIGAEDQGVLLWVISVVFFVLACLFEGQLHDAFMFLNLFFGVVGLIRLTIRMASGKERSRYHLSFYEAGNGNSIVRPL